MHIINVFSLYCNKFELLVCTWCLKSCKIKSKPVKSVFCSIFSSPTRNQKIAKFLTRRHNSFLSLKIRSFPYVIIQWRNLLVDPSEESCVQIVQWTRQLLLVALTKHNKNPTVIPEVSIRRFFCDWNLIAFLFGFYSTSEFCRVDVVEYYPKRFVTDGSSDYY